MPLENKANILSEYENKKQKNEKASNYYCKKMKQFSNLRLLVAVLGTGISVYLLVNNNILSGIAAIFGSLFIFIFLVIKHRLFSQKEKYFRTLANINAEGISRFKGNWNSFKDTGEEFLEESHPYAKDLNLFGQGSFFQWINSTTTFSGRNWLNYFLTRPCHHEKQIKKRQDAILELSSKLDWRQNLTAQGRLMESKLKNPKSLFTWAKKRHNFYLKPSIYYGTKILPIVTVSLIILTFFMELPYVIAATLLISQILIIIYGHSKRLEDFNLTTKFNQELISYKNMLLHVENENFSSELLSELQQELWDKELKTKASIQLSQLNKIVEKISHRSIQLYTIFNVLFLLDYHWQISLEKWKKQFGGGLENWFDTLGKIEALSSLGTIPFDNPNWTIPKIAKEPNIFETKEMGHPLLTNKRVCNDVQISPPVNTLLITGSNMSGKSTLLRTAGMNLVMTYIGTPVCAKYLSASIMKVYSCMQVSDNLEKNISTFYAELLRIQNIVETSKKEPVFFLLDEIFKGTNSKDRHIGAKTVIKKLQKEGAIGLVSTHDLELGELEKESPGIKNYHFREYYENGEIKFDYILRPGISPTTNATYLMKLAGIEPSETQTETQT